MAAITESQAKLVVGSLIGGFLGTPSDGCPMDHSKDNFRSKYLIFKLNYFISFLITTSFFLLTFLISISRLSNVITILQFAYIMGHVD
jgi:hypothetical protein